MIKVWLNHSFIQHLLSAYCVPGTVLGAEIQRCIRYSPCPEGFTVWKGRQTCKQVKYSVTSAKEKHLQRAEVAWGEVFLEEGAFEGDCDEQVFARQTRQEEQGKGIPVQRNSMSEGTEARNCMS